MGAVVSIVESVDISVDISVVESVVNIPAVNKAKMSCCCFFFFFFFHFIKDITFNNYKQCGFVMIKFLYKLYLTRLPALFTLKMDYVHKLRV